MRDPALRLGSGLGDAEEIKSHPFFEGLDWKALENKQIPPPWKPSLINETDTSKLKKKYTYADIDEATPPVHALALYYVERYAVGLALIPRFYL